MIGQFDLPQARWPPKESYKFIYRPNPNWLRPHKYQLMDAKCQHYYSQYLSWQQETNDPMLRQANWWADNWELLGKYL